MFRRGGSTAPSRDNPAKRAGTDKLASARGRLYPGVWMRTGALVLAGAPLVLALVAGCARSAEERQLDSMRAEIDRLQDERDRSDRSGLVQEQPATPRTAPSAAASPAPASSAVAPNPGSAEEGRSPAPGSDGPAAQAGTGDNGSDDYADPEDTTPRPRIRVLGSARATGRDYEQVDEGTPSSADSPGPHTLDPQAKPAYDAAMSLVNAKKYDAALDALAAFLVKWPDHPYADHAMYWRGECYFARGDYAHAADQFEGVVARFPAGAKVPDALLKLGISQQKLGNTPKAKECFDRLVRDFPQSDAARRLAAMSAGGRAQ
jgi:tol-pal system protein YbgF